MKWHTFSFTPTKLILTRKKLVKNNIDLKNRIKRTQKKDILELLARIEKTPFDRIREFAFSLSLRELYQLVYYFPTADIESQARKICEIIKLRFKKEFVEILWSGFQKNYINRKFCMLFSEILSLQKELYVRFFKNIKIYMVVRAWVISEQVTNSIFRYISRQGIDLDDFFAIYQIKEDTMLAKDIRKYIYLYCSEDFYLKEGGAKLRNIIEQYNNEQMIIFTENYLSKVSFVKLQSEVMKFLFEHKKKPEDKKLDYFWSNISDKCFKKFCKWIYVNTIKKAFRDDRREFWMRYLDLFEDMTFIDKYGQLFMYFKNYVVVEFASSGAIHVYRRDYFKKRFQHYANNYEPRNDSFFKVPREAMRIAHRGDNWQYAADNAMLNILNDNFIPNVTVRVSGKWIYTDTKLPVGGYYA